MAALEGSQSSGAADSQWALPEVILAGYSVTTTTSTTTTTTNPPAPPPVAVPVAHVVAPTTTVPKPKPAPAPPPPAAPSHQETGAASWYAQAAPGYCASPDLAFGTVVTVTDLSTGASVTCTIDDREAQNPGRVIDMSEQGFSQLAPLSTGIIQVSVRW